MQFQAFKLPWNWNIASKLWKSNDKSAVCGSNCHRSWLFPGILLIFSSEDQLFRWTFSSRSNLGLPNKEKMALKIKWLVWISKMPNGWPRDHIRPLDQQSSTDSIPEIASDLWNYFQNIQINLCGTLFKVDQLHFNQLPLPGTVSHCSYRHTAKIYSQIFW